MTNEFTAIVERDGKWFIAYCPEVPGANGQGKTKDEAISSLAEAIALILADRREEACVGSLMMQSLRKWPCETEHRAAPLQKRGLFPQERGTLPFSMVEPADRRCGGRTASHGDL